MVILLCLYAGVTEIYTDEIIGTAPEFTQTGENGFQAGDQIYKVNGYRTYVQGEAKMFLDYAGDTADIEVVRDGTHILLEDLPRSTFTSADGSTYTGFGIYVGVGVQEATLAKKICSTRGIRRWISCSWCASAWCSSLPEEPDWMISAGRWGLSRP